mmetsp:Transcript_4778/g.7093  ORF Transcript_4778/g.7093 Transcript_4778/m.7093 type:complete len:467 (+) Transcript_4778:57-1457(+)
MSDTAMQDASAASSLGSKEPAEVKVASEQSATATLSQHGSEDAGVQQKRSDKKSADGRKNPMDADNNMSTTDGSAIEASAKVTKILKAFRDANLTLNKNGKNFSTFETRLRGAVSIFGLHDAFGVMLDSKKFVNVLFAPKHLAEVILLTKKDLEKFTYPKLKRSMKLERKVTLSALMGCTADKILDRFQAKTFDPAMFYASIREAYMPTDRISVVATYSRLFTLDLRQYSKFSALQSTVDHCLSKLRDAGKNLPEDLINTFVLESLKPRSRYKNLYLALEPKVEKQTYVKFCQALSQQLKSVKYIDSEREKDKTDEAASNADNSYYQNSYYSRGRGRGRGGRGRGRHGRGGYGRGGYGRGNRGDYGRNNRGDYGRGGSRGRDSGNRDRGTKRPYGEYSNNRDDNGNKPRNPKHKNCFTCGKDHKVWECPHRGTLASLVEKKNLNDTRSMTGIEKLASELKRSEDRT